MPNEAVGDPGWGSALRRVWPALVIPFPHVAPLLARKADGLTRLRALFLSFAAQPIPITIVMWFVSRDFEPEESALLWVAICVAMGLSELAMITFFVRRKPLVPPDQPAGEKSDPVAVGGAYRNLALLGASLSLSTFLTGFVATFITERFALLFVGMPFMAIGLLLSAPTRANLARRQEELRLQGSSVDLVEAVKSAPWGKA